MRKNPASCVHIKLYELTFLTQMAGQKSLTAFFKPLNNGGVKRNFSEVVTGSLNSDNQSPKKQVSKFVF